jgi:hypothetical protein
MNKKVVLIAAVVLIALGIGVFFLTRPSSLPMEQFFPSQTLMYVRLSHVQEDLKQYSQSEFWKNISNIDFIKILEHNNVPSRDIKQIQKVQKEIQLFMDNPLTKKFLGTEIGMGFYEKEASKGKDSLNSYDALFATRLGFSLQMAELFSSVASKESDQITTTDENYKGSKIVHVHFSKRKIDLQYTRIHDILFVSFVPSTILHHVIDVDHKSQSALMADPDFSKAFSQAYQSGHGVFYINIQKFFDIFNTRIPDNQKKNFEKVSEVSAGFKSYTVSFLPGETSKIRMMMQFEPSKLSPSWHSLLSCPGAPNPSLKFVPHNVMFYDWGQCYDFKNMWEHVNAASSDDPNAVLQKWPKKIEKRFKLDISKDVLPILGSQVGGYLSEIDTQGVFPYPRGVIFIKVEDTLAAKQLMQKFTKKSIVPLQKEEYQKVPIYYMSLPLGANMEPGYTLLGDYLLLGSSRESLRTSIEAFNNPNQSLLSNDLLKNFNLDASDVNQGMIFIKVDEISGRLQQLLDWYNKVVSSQITGALTYQQEFKDRQQEWEVAYAAKKEELRVAQEKYKDIESKVLPLEATDEEKANLQANKDHLSSDINILQEDLESFKKQELELRQALAAYKAQSEAAKLWLFNSDEVLKPLLKAFESFHALGMKWYLSGPMSETEISIK